MNQVTISGRLTRDAEQRTFGNGGSVTKFGIAVEVYKHKDSNTGQWTNKVCFVNCVAFNRGEFGKLAQRAAELKKGQMIWVSGKLDSEEWTNKEGKKITHLSVAVDDFVKVETERRENQQQHENAIAEDSPF